MICIFTCACMSGYMCLHVQLHVRTCDPCLDAWLHFSCMAICMCMCGYMWLHKSACIHMQDARSIYGVHLIAAVL